MVVFQRTVIPGPPGPPGPAGDPATLRSVMAAQATPARAAVSGVVATLNRGTRSAVMQIVGDSTGTDPDEWWGIMALRLAADHPGYDVAWRQWNDATQRYDMPTPLVGPCDRAVDLTGNGQMRLVMANVYQADQEVRAGLDLTSWTTGGAVRTIAARYNPSGTNRLWHFFLNATGNLCWTWSAAGTADTGTVVSTAAVPFTDGRGYVRVFFDVDNGATGNTATFYTSTDGTTWTQLGTPVVTAGVTTVGPATQTQDIYIGARNGAAADFLAGTIFWIEYRPGTGTVSVVPPLPDHWERNTTAATPSVQWVGKPLLMLVNASVSGTGLAYHDDPTRRPIELQPQGQQVVFVSTSHNEANPSNAVWIASLNTYVTNLKTSLPRVPVILATQNPGTLPLTPQNIEVREQRGANLLTYAASQAGVYGLDTRQAFAGVDLTTVVEPADGVHPTQGDGGTSGSDLWGNYAYDLLFS